VRTPLLNGRADVLHQFGDRATTQFAATVDGALLMTKDGASLAARELNDAAVVVSVNGGAPEQKFEVLVDEVVRGTVRAGGEVALFMQPYQQYDIRLRPTGAQIASFDTSPKSVTLYPGNVAGLNWKVTPLFVLFGRAIGPDRRPIAEAEINGSFGLGRTDANGYFQVETREGDRLAFSSGAGRQCHVTVARASQLNGYVSAGDLMCQ
jgi:outer membrane usher protein FimD/PapC